MDLTVFEPNTMNCRALRSIEVTRLKCLCYGTIVKLIGFDHDPTAEGIPVAGIRIGTVVIIIRGNTEDLLTAAQHIVVNVRTVILEGFYNTACIADFHSVHIMVVHVLRIFFERPSRMIIRHKETGIAAALHNIADTFRGINTFVIRFGFIKLYLITVIDSISELVFAAVPARLREIIRLKCDHAQMAGLLAGNTACNFLVDLHLKAVQRQEIFVTKLRMLDQYIMIGICNNGVSVCHIDFFKLLRCEFTVGHGRMAMHVGFVKLSGFGNKIFFHGLLLQSGFSVSLKFTSGFQTNR